MNNNKIENWKLKEIINDIKLIHFDSQKYLHETFKRLKLPLSIECNYDTSQTDIDWDKMPIHYKFYFDKAGWEDKIQKALESSELKDTKNIIITYGWDEPTVIVPVKLFFEDWEGFVASTIWQTVMFSEDYKLIMEVSRDYYLHSNFKILDE